MPHSPRVFSCHRQSCLRGAQIAISPVGTSVQPQGYSCAATGIAIDDEGTVTFGDDGGCNGSGEGGGGANDAAASSVAGAAITG